MDIEKSLKKLDKWFRAMTWSCIAFAFITFILWAGLSSTNIASYTTAVARVWFCLALTFFFGITAVTVKKIYKILVLMAAQK